MEEKIIIDGVDVSKCKHYDDICYEEDRFPLSCKGNDCMFKQLKRLQEKYDTLTNKFFNSETDKTRLEQENEKIKKQYNCYACGNCKGTEDYINLEKHHKGLRKRFDEIQALFNDEYFKGLDKQTVIELAKKSIRVTTYNRELEHALEEIKKIASKVMTEDWTVGYDDILQIITEAIGE